MLAYHLHGTNLVKPALSATKLSTVALEVLKDDIKEEVQRSFPDDFCSDGKHTFLQWYQLLGWNDPNLRIHWRSTRLIVVHGELAFIAKCQNAWYNEHLRGFELESTQKLKVIEQKELADIYPLTAYAVGQKCMVTLKHHICLQY